MNRINMWSFHVILGLFVLGGINSPLWNTDAYNIESKHYTSYRRERSSMFGFSVAEYRDSNKRGWVVVGAPQAQTDVRNVYRGGAVYKCNVAIDDDCNQIVFDNQEHNQARQKEPHDQVIQIDNKTMQWFGATVATSAQDGGPILACAPRYVFFGVAPGKNQMSHRNELAFGNQRDPVGTCFLMDLTAKDKMREFSPCRTKNYGFHKQGSCQAGFGAAISKNGERIFVGAPGSWYWQGQMYSIPRSGKYPFSPPWNQPYGVVAGQMYTQSRKDPSQVQFTKEASAVEDDRYLGYTVTSGDFIGNGVAGTAVGAPRGDNLYGMVILLTWNMTEIQKISGAQMGSYFGYALAAGDIDNDGLDDLIVGAPMYTVIDNPQGHFETGKVYIFYGRGPDKYTVFDERSGEDNRGRFGMSLAYLGDIDHDGYGDFAVGAPYAGPGGRGAVYIYQGSPDGLLEKASQVIYGEELSSRIETFGFSIAGGLDLDQNLYPDMVVGSYESDSAMFFRSRPVIKMVALDTYVQFVSSDKLVALEDRECLLSDGTRVSCLQLRTCFKYTGDGVLPKYDFNVEYVLDSQNPKSPRMCFLDHEGKHTMNVTIGANRNEQYCRTVKVYIIPNIRDKLTSLDAEMRMSLEDDLRVDNRPRNPSLPLRPILARTSSRKDSVSIRKNCGLDNICTPDLQLNCTSRITEYLMGSNEKIVLEVNVVNAYEDAYEAMFNLRIPPGIDYIKIDRIDQAEIPVQCSPVRQGNNATLKCDIGNPLPMNNIVKFNVILQPSLVHQEMSSYNFEAEANSSNHEDISTTHDNKKEVSIKIWVKTDLAVEGESRPKDVYYNPANYTTTNVTTESEYGPGFTHNYTIHNGGPFTIEEAEIWLIWPMATLAGDDLVYLLEQPETSGPITCMSANSNPLSLKLEQKTRTWQSRYPDSASSGGSISGSTSFTSESGAYGGSDGRVGGGSSGYPHIPPYDDSETGSTGSVSGSSGSSVSGGRGSSSGTSSTSNSSHKVSYGPNGEVIVVEDEWKQTGGIITSVDVKTSITEKNYKETRRQEEHSGYDETRRQEEHSGYDETRRQDGQNYEETRRQQKMETARRLQEEEDLRRRQEEETIERRRQQEQANERRHQQELAAGRRRQEQEAYERRRLEEEERTKKIVYGTEKTYGSSGDVLTHGVIGGGSVLATGMRTDQRISGDREETVRGTDFGFQSTNLTSSRDLASFLSTLTRDSVGYDVFTENGRQFLRFLGRFRVSGDGKEYVEFKDGTTFALENRYGTPSVASGSRADLDRRYNRLEGRIVPTEGGKCYIELRDGRRFALKGSYTYSEERTYTSGGGGRQASSSTFSTSGHRTTADDEEELDEYEDDYGTDWQEETTNRGRDADREFETHSTRTHEERRTFERKHGSRVYGRQDETDTPLGDDPSTYHQDSGLHKRGSRHRREGDDAMSVKEFRDYEKKHRIHKRENEPFYDDSAVCKATTCVSLRCTLGRLEKDQEAWISARFRVNAATLRKIAAYEELKVSTQLVSQVTKLPTVGKPEKNVLRSHEIYTSLQPQAPAPAPDVVPLWIVVLSACAGVIILLLLIYLLHKCGFFKRNRPTDAPERQPLNRNGHFHGDDHL